MNAEKILDELKIGNERFIRKEPKSRSISPADLADNQNPKTIVLTCADSRVPPELIFDQDLGELFVVRVPGNTATDEAIGSIEYSVTHLGSVLCIVMGHTGCIAVTSAIEHIKNGSALPSDFFKKVVDPVMSSVEDALVDNPRDVLTTSVKLNIKNTIKTLSEKSDILKEMIQQNTFKIVGATYDLTTGKVRFT